MDALPAASSSRHAKGFFDGSDVAAGNRRSCIGHGQEAKSGAGNSLGGPSLLLLRAVNRAHRISLRFGS